MRILLTDRIGAIEWSSARNTKPRGKSMEKEAMIYVVECSRDVEDT